MLIHESLQRNDPISNDRNLCSVENAVFLSSGEIHEINPNKIGIFQNDFRLL